MIRLFACTSFIFFILAPLSFAAIDDVTVQFRYGTDTEPPTVPDPVTVVPVASTQIDITWGASTDNIQLNGYQLFRDAVQIATTSLTSYSDTGLTASTTYSYTVVAFDLFENFSSSSVSVATTTLQPPPPPPEATSTPPVRQPGTLLIVERVFSLNPSTNGAHFAWEMNLPVTFELRYGRTSAFDDGIVRGGVFATEHQTVITGLEPGTTYEYQLVVTDPFNRTRVLRAGTFTTDSLPDTTAPANAGLFRATAISGDVLLDWQNPLDEDFAYVRVVRNHRFFPQHPDDGFVVYEGSGTAVTDTGALASYDRQYYTIFTYDATGNRSSGAVAVARRYVPGATPPSPSTPGAPVDSTETPPTTGGTPPPSGAAEQADILLYAEAIFLEQGEQRMTLADADVTILTRNSYLIAIGKEALPQHLKSIIVTVNDPTDQRQVSAVLLQYNEASGRYEAQLPAVYAVGESNVTVEVYDFEIEKVREIRVPVRFVAEEDAAALRTAVLVTAWWSSLRPLLLLAGVALSLWWFLLLWRRRREDEDNS